MTPQGEILLFSLTLILKQHYIFHIKEQRTDWVFYIQMIILGEVFLKWFNVECFEIFLPSSTLKLLSHDKCFALFSLRVMAQRQSTAQLTSSKMNINSYR